MASQIDTPDIETQDISTRTGMSVLTIMWQRKSLVVLGIMLGLVLGLLYYAQKQPIYQSTAAVLIVKKSGDTPMDFGRADGRMVVMEDYIATQQTVIQSPSIITRALKRPPMKDLKTLTSDNDWDRIYDIQQMLIVMRDNQQGNSGAPSNVVRLQFRGPVPSECQTILQEIITSYQNFLDEVYKNVNQHQLDLFTKAKDDLMVKHEEAQKKYLAFRATSPIIIFPGDKGAVNPVMERLGKIEGRRSDLRIKMGEMVDQLARVQKAYKDGGPEKGNQEALRVIKELGIKTNLFEGTSKFEDRLFDLKLQKQMLVAGGAGVNHPQVKQIENQIVEIERALGKPQIGLDANNKANAMDAKSYIDTMKDEINDLQTRIFTLDNLIDGENKTMKEMSQFLATEEALKNAKDQSSKLLDALLTQISRMESAKDFGGYNANEIAPPSQARKVSPNALTVFPLAGIGGLIAGLCLAYLAELSDKSFRTPAEIRRRLGLPVIGHIPYYAPDEKAAKLIAAGEPVVDPMLCAHYRSNAVESEAFRSVRTALYFNTHGVGHQVIQVTSPNVSDGKSTLAANLAVSIAQSGKRTIMIDGDCRRPRIHKIFNVPADSGLATVIMGQSDLATAIRPTSIPNLSVLPCGPRPANPAELLTSPRFKELLDIIRSQYEFVIIDTPPLLVVTDPCVVAPRVDGVILAIRVTKNGRPYAERAKEILTSLGANVLGVVVNGLGSPAGGKYGYQYGQYQYGYGYAYRYSYTYMDEYTDDKAASYYNTEPTGDTPAEAPVEEK